MWSLTSFLLIAAAIPAAISQITNSPRTTEYYQNEGIRRRGREREREGGGWRQRIRID